MQHKKYIWVIYLFIITVLVVAPAEVFADQKASTAQPPAKQNNSSKTTTASPKIKNLQQLLANTGFYPGSMTGVLDKSTKDAILVAQKTLKLKQTGQYDQKLADLLKQESQRKPNSFRKMLSMQATAYTSQDPGCGSLTKREHYLRKGLVAVDPKTIPLGTRLYIEGYGYAIADDIGSAIKGNKIDLAYESRSEAFKFGRKTVSVLVLD